MTVDVIREIRQAEEQAAQIVRDSAAEAREIAAAAQEEADRIRREAEAGARREAERRLSLAEKKAGEAVSAIESQVEGECGAIAKAARAKFAEAAEIIAGRIVTFNVDS
ncbi:MAG: hypothetical protein LBJ10_02300 [Clostridiales bacterium]|nr:hypothetical protein [Clostridiales bacterium]